MPISNVGIMTNSGDEAPSPSTETDNSRESDGPQPGFNAEKHAQSAEDQTEGRDSPTDDTQAPHDDPIAPLEEPSLRYWQSLTEDELVHSYNGISLYYQSLLEEFRTNANEAVDSY
ncbi:MAG TPA: hypothetical protein VE031_00445, partial [Chthoniobacterales bacterium]|nr:hypothetical protein [Chthoniobacterales bacterium]